MSINPVLQIEPSVTVTINSLALQKKQQGMRVYNLSAGEPMVSTPAVVVQAAEEAMRGGKTHYPPVQGVSELLSAASTWMNTTYQTNYTPANGIVTCGGKFGIYALLQALLSPGDEVLIPAPYWVSYPGMTKLFHGVPKIITTSSEQNWKISPVDIEKNCTEKAKILILNNASNPTGVLYSRSELQALLQIAVQKNLTVISDEVYSGLVYDGSDYISCGSFPEYAEQVCVIQSCSKSFAMTGWRVGFVFGPAGIIKVLTMLQGQSTTGTSSISQWAAVAALGNAATITPTINSAMKKRRDVFMATFNRLFQQNISSPPSALYAFLSLASMGVTHGNSVRFCEELLEKGNVAVVPGLAFGQEGYVRFAFGEKEEELTEGLEAMRKFIV